MSRAPGLCRRCGGPKRGRAARVASPIAQCYKCGDDICERHSRWHDDGYLCTKCAQKIGLKEYGIAERRVSLPERHWEPVRSDIEPEEPDERNDEPL